MSLKNPDTRTSNRQLTAVICISMTYLVGCGHSSNDQVSSATTPYEVADDDSQTDSQPISQFDPLEDQLDSDFSGDSHDSGHSAEMVTSNAPESTDRSSSQSPSRHGRDTPAKNDSGLAEGTPEQLLEHIAEIEQRVATNQIRGSTREERTAEFHRMMKSRKSAAEQVLAQEHEREQGLVASHAKLDSLNALASTEAPGVMDEFLDYAESLMDHSEEDIRTAGTMARLEGLTRLAMSGEKDATDQLRTVADSLIDSDNEHIRFEAVQSRLMLMSQSVDASVENAEQELTDFTASLSNDPNPKVAEVVRLTLFSMQLRGLSTGQIEDASVIIDSLQSLLEISDKSPNILETSSIAILVLSRTDHFDEAAQAGKIIAEAFANSDDTQLATQTLRQLTNYAAELESRNPAAAGKLYDQIGQVYANHKVRELADTAREYAEMGQRRVSLVGKPLELTGVQNDGDTFDWSQYAGKVVLVDFWATWCEPCVKEIPNMKKNYERFREQGFEVVGINLDQDPLAAQKFIESEGIPWTNIVGDQEEGSNANALRCGVEGIPFILLVGRDGNVAALHVRGDEMQPRIEAMLAESHTGGEQTSADNRSKDSIRTSAVERTANQ